MSGGYRNTNVLLIADDGGRYVVRRWRHGNTCAVEEALAQRLVGIAPVAEVIATDPDGTTTGEPTMLSRFVSGVLVDDVLTRLTDDEAAELGRCVGAVLAAVGTVTFAGPGFFTEATLTPSSPDIEDLPTFVAGCLDRCHPEHGLTCRDRAGLRALATRDAGLADAVRDARQLVHADYNPKNLLAQRDAAGWRITAVLDWEFAFSGSPLVDVGNMLRFRDSLPPAYTSGFVAGFGAAGGRLPPGWQAASQALDLYSLADFLTRPPSDVSRQAVGLIRRRLRSV